MPSDQTSVAVIISAFNSAATVCRSVKSALAQAEVAECIVVDDASQDATSAAAREADDGSGRLNVVRLSQNSGPAAARNLAIETCRSDLICVLDADDYFVDGRLARLLNIATEFDFIADNILIVPEECDSPSAVSQRQLVFERAGSTTLQQLDLQSFVRGNISRRGQPRSELGFLKPVMRRSFLKTHGISYQPQLRLGEDYALYIEALLAGARFFLAGLCGYVAIERRNSLSSSHSASDLSNLVDFDRKCLKNDQLGQGERDVLRRHLRSVYANAEFRHVLQVRAERGLAAGVARALRRPSQLGYMISETLHAKWRLARTMVNPQTEVLGERLLIRNPSSVNGEI